jgi:hypothetical protein
MKPARLLLLGMVLTRTLSCGATGRGYTDSDVVVPVSEKELLMERSRCLT